MIYNIMNEAFKGSYDYQRQKKQNNLSQSTDILIKNKIAFESHNNGIHLVVMNRWDYWPSTGLFIDRTNKKQGRGIFNLLRLART
jgi:hypothetical protein